MSKFGHWEMGREAIHQRRNIKGRMTFDTPPQFISQRHCAIDTFPILDPPAELEREECREWIFWVNRQK